jgi:uncharacterized BrkB/YihY/UPF0761 family membrane protein
MLAPSKMRAYRLVWLVGALMVLASVFPAFAYNQNLISMMQEYIPKTLDVLHEPSGQNIAITSSVAGFILLLVSGLLCTIYALVAHKEKAWSAPAGVRIWNASVLALLSVVLFVSPVFIYLNGELYQVLSDVGTQYSPMFEGFSIGFYLVVIGVVLAYVAGKLVMKNSPWMQKNKAK